VLHFLKAKGTPVPLNPHPLLVTKGPYKYIRNPMLTGLFFILVGLGIGFNSFSLLFIFTPLFIAINYFELTLIEEPELLKRLGNKYYIYRNNTPMFIPGLKPKRNHS
jgi:protein-S-isoprenylcysteine O-methyltransferase Ste14